MTHDWYSYYLLFFPRWDEAIAVQRRAVQLDPLAVIISADLGVVLMHAGRWDEAIEHLRKTLELDPRNAFLLGALGVAYVGKGMYPEALMTFQKRIDTSGPDAGILFSVALAHAKSGDITKALQILKEAKDMNRNQPGNRVEPHTDLPCACDSRQALPRRHVRVAGQSLRRALDGPSVHQYGGLGALSFRSPLHRLPQEAWIDAIG